MLIWWRLKTFTTDSRRRTTWAESRPHVRPVSRLHPREFLIMQKRHQLTRPSVLLCVLTLLAGAAHAQWAPMNPVTAVQQQPDGVVFTMQTGTLKLQVCADSIIRVRYSATSTFSDRPDLSALPMLLALRRQARCSACQSCHHPRRNGGYHVSIRHSDRVKVL